MLIQKPDTLCYFVLGTSPDTVLHIVDNIEDYYDEFKKFKKDKFGNKRLNKPKYREEFGLYYYRCINPPKPELKTIQKKLNSYLVKFIDFPDYAYGGVKGRDNILNACVHKGQKYVFQTDLKDFFPSITNRMVYNTFVLNGFSPDVAALMTKLTTYEGHLPQGSPTSTTIANLVFAKTGEQIKQITEQNQLRFTTFVDDITISSQFDFKHLVPDIIKIVTDAGFKISQGKTTYKSGITEITGVRLPNNSLTTTLKFKSEIAKETNKSGLRYQGMKNYSDRIHKLGKQHHKI